LIFLLFFFARFGGFFAKSIMYALAFPEGVGSGARTDLTSVDSTEVSASEGKNPSSGFPATP